MKWFPPTKRIGFKLLSDKAKPPRRGTEDSAGLDLFTVEDYSLKPQESVKLETNVAFVLPKDTFGLICPRSSAFGKNLYTHGVLDQDFSSQVFLVFQNLGKETIEISKEKAYAQLIVVKYENLPLVPVDELPKTKRGSQGFGSTGYSA